MNEEQRQYLNELRDSGVTNMWGAPAFLVRRYDITEEEATKIFLEWKAQFKRGA